MKVNEATRKVMGAEIEWLPSLIPNWIEEFQVKMIDLDTLSLRPSGLSVLRDKHGLPRARVLLLDKDGVEIGGVGEFSKLVTRWEFTKRFPFVRTLEDVEIRTERENVEGALKRFSEWARNVRYILEFDGLRATLHKMPRKMTDLPTWIEQKSVETLGSLQRALNQDR